MPTQDHQDHHDARRPTTRRRVRQTVSALLVLFVGLAILIPEVDAAPSPAEAQARREQIRQERADLAARIEPLQATAEDLADAVRTLESNERAQAAKVADARRAADDAQRRHRDLADRQAELERQQAQLRNRVRERAVSSYVNPAGRVDESELVLQSNDLTSAERKRELVDSVTGTNRDAIDQLRSNREEILAVKQDAEAAAKEAADKQDEAQRALDAQHKATTDKAKVKAAYDQRIAGLRSEASQLAGEDANLQKIIADAQIRYAAQIKAAQQAEADRQARARAAATAATATSSAPSSAAGNPATTGSSAAPGTSASTGSSAPASTGRAAPPPPGPATTRAPAPATPPPSPPPSSGRMVWPFPGGRVSQEFGVNGHPGIDIFGPQGSPIVAARGGVVISAGWNNGGYGNLTLIDHGGGIVTAYAHQVSIGVTVGQTVSAGQVIGQVGSTGNSTGPHLHFEVRVNGQVQNPRNYL